MLRIIGDELADRGQNDYFMLLVIKHLLKGEVKLNVVLSNHAFEFIKMMENDLNPNCIDILPLQANSAYKLSKSIENGFIAKKDVQDLYESYKPLLTLCDYQYDEKENSIKLYAHAGFGLNTIEELAEALGVDYQDTTLFELMKTIDDMNQRFQMDLRSGPVSENPIIYDFVWNRDYIELVRPKDHNGYTIGYVHGHDSNDPSPEEHIVTVNALVGKGANAHKDRTGVLCSRVIPETSAANADEYAFDDPGQTSLLSTLKGGIFGKVPYFSTVASNEDTYKTCTFI